MNCVYVRDLQLGETVLASGAWDGGTADANTRDPTSSGDGRHVGFATEATIIVVGDFNGLVDSRAMRRRVTRRAADRILRAGVTNRTVSSPKRRGTTSRRQRSGSHVRTGGLARDRLAVAGHCVGRRAAVRVLGE